MVFSGLLAAGGEQSYIPEPIIMIGFPGHRQGESVFRNMVDGLRRIPGLWIHAIILTFLIGLGIWAVQVENDLSFYWRDPAAIVNTGPWIGLFSNIGNFIWWIASIPALFTAALLRTVPGHQRAAAFLFSWGALTAFLALDDFFMIHEWVIPTYLPLSEDFLFVVYFFTALGLLAVFRNELRQTPYPVFFFALCCFAGSIIIDLIGPARFQDWGMSVRYVWNLEYIVEDGLKLAGIIAWAHFFVLTSLGYLRPLIQPTAATETKTLPAHRRKRRQVR
jgi:hypothetical protein